MTTTTTSAEFGDRVRAVLAGLPTSGVMDRFAANDVLLDLLDVAGSEEEQARVMRALADLPTSKLVDRTDLNAIIAGLCGQN
ncbi:MAG TPA: hypothetical protein VFE55_01845 [Acidimicrobiia bacterium]|nr:hypothetical protein [Acidimicrobiia bacterium]